ncbi:MAG: integration host factor subunit alpha [Gammaproteobacteria bacterium]|nr:integration host factor subunit alpha [Gammaproteobacteria bacterium]CAJ2375942.1 MAG: Integration host factor subunit alpha [Arenicellales bacterium IbO2]MDA7962088.1 integration host factor subunit alpha [Gammaproteobacteria bacterium]MDA7968226.1 integration host factor subunit alpha [Gammaproteobacteria bacterium]MDA7969224.1 integration host factor subunit alpha [Gammaproteobacteria bacterium]
MTVTKSTLRGALFGQVGLNKREAGDFVELFFERVRAALEDGTAVKLSGFGSFIPRDKPPRPGRNPRTGEAAPVSARRVVTFKASRKLKQDVLENSMELTHTLGRKSARRASEDAQAD